ncbi:precorrin-3B synthase [Cupriavidus sp. BIC8F]|uniref:precorrin-3B synthase n=1 Tax=Cupriavidus sp. BIC8F TaxID=3079014 RepID=UPI002916C4BC|nr:precorrin-3B synthase [Cupriavidus sp. BIC8F]
MSTSNCPGLLHIVPTRDGGICRIRLSGGMLSAAHAEALAHAAEQYASGPIDVTNRANLQVRGIRAGHEAAFSMALIQAGLGPGGQCDLSPQAAAAQDTVRNLMISPVAGRDPAATIDTRPVAEALLAMLLAEPRFAQLSPKFALMLDGGERLAMREHPHDIWLLALPRTCPDADACVQFAFGFAGCPPSGIELASVSRAWGATSPSQVTALVRALLHAFLDLAQPGQSRMRDLLVTHSPEQLLQQARTYLDFAPAPVPEWPQTIPADPMLRFGPHRQRDASRWWIGAQPPLGRLDTSTLRALAQLAREVSASSTLHMTPWQGVLLPDVAQQDIDRTMSALTRLGFACTGREPLARMIACTGSSGCARALADTKADATALAQRLGASHDIHLSGCPRSCAAAHQSAHTLLAVAPGTYDMYRRDGSTGFGTCAARHVSLEQAAGEIARSARSTSDV